MLWEILNNCKLLDLFFFLKLRFNLICVHFHFSSDELDSMSSTERISFLQEKLQEIRKYYMTLKSEVASIDRRRKRLKKKEREGRRACRQTLTSSACFLRRALLHQYRLCLTRSQCCFLSVAISLIARSLKWQFWFLWRRCSRDLSSDAIGGMTSFLNHLRSLGIPAE